MGGSGNWNVPLNWSGGILPTNGGDLTFGTLTPGAFRPTTDNLAALTSVNSITFSGAGYTGNGALNGDAFSLVSGITVVGGLGTETVNNAITFTPTTTGLQSTISVGSASTLDLAGQLQDKEPAVGPVSAAVETAKVTVAKTGAGTLQLDGSNGGLTGAIAIATSGGVIQITNASALGLGVSVAGAPNSGTTTISPGGQLQLNGTTKPLTNIAEQLFINGTGIINDGALLNFAGNNVWSGPITMNANSSNGASIGANVGTTLNVAGVLGDTGSAESVTKVGPGTLVFSHQGGNTYHGQTIIDNGILEIEDPLSLGAGANALLTSYNGQPQSETIVNYNPVTGVAGTLELNFSTLAANDPNGILEFPNSAYHPTTFNAKTNPYVGFQVFGDLLVLNGPGFNPLVPNTSGLSTNPYTSGYAAGVLGALYNASGNNAWDGNVILGSPSNVPDTGDVTIGAAANSNVAIEGIVSSATPIASPSANLQKIGAGTLTLSNANTFTGNVFIEQGAINIGNSQALGSAATNNVLVGYYPIYYQGGTYVEQATVSSEPGGTLLPSSLQLEVDSGNPNTPVTSSNPNVSSIYDGVIGSTPATSRSHYRDLGFDSTNLSGPGQELDISGSSGTFTLSDVVYNVAGVSSTFTTTPLNIASTTLTSDIQGAVWTMLNNLLLSEGLPAVPSADVSVSEDIGSSGVVYRILFSGSLLQTNIPLMASSNSAVQTNAIYGLTVANPLFLNGTGLTSNAGGTGALDSISGLNTYTGPIVTSEFPPVTTPIPRPSFVPDPTLSTLASIGVDADPRPGHNLGDSNYLTDDYSLTITGNGTTSGILGPSSGLIAGEPFTTLDKFGLGNLILPTANGYEGPTNVEQGWITVGNNQSLGVQQNLTQTLQSYTTVASGAAIMLDPQSGFLALANNFILSGNGILPGAVVPNVFGLIDQGGAIENLTGNNLLTGIIQLDGNAGIGVEQVYAEANATTSTNQLGFPATGTAPTSQLTISGTLYNFTDPVSGTVTPGGITKLGSRRLIIEGPGTYTGNVVISEGVILDQNNTGLGAGNVTSPPTVTVEPGAALEIGNTSTAEAINNSLGGATFTSSESGGIQEGLGIWGENLILNGSGDPTFGDTALTILSSNATTTGPTVYTLAVSSGTSGDFFLSFNGALSGPIPTNATVAQLQAALATILPTGGTVVVTQSGNLNGNVYSLTFGGSLINTSIPLLVNNTFPTVSGVGMVPIVTAGNFSLIFNGQYTAQLPANATATQVQAALTSILGTGQSVTVTENAGEYVFTFGGSLANTTTPIQIFTGTETIVQVTEIGTTSTLLAPVNDPLVSTDDVWEGPVSLGGIDPPPTVPIPNINDNTITIPTNSRLIIAGNITNGANAPVQSGGYGGAGLVLTGGGELDLDGNNSYNGTTFVEQGVLTAGSNTALGTTGTPEIQTLRLTNVVPGSTKFELTYTTLSGDIETTAPILYTGTAGNLKTGDEAAILNALNALPGIAGTSTPTTTGTDAGGLVTNVVEVPGGATASITIDFGGTLNGFPLNQLGAVITSPIPAPPLPTPTITVSPLTPQTIGEGGTIVANGASLQLSGAITIAGEPLIVQGTGSLPDIQTLTNNATNDPNDGTFNLSFTGKDSTGGVVTDTTTSPIGDTDSNIVTEIQDGLLSLGNIGGIGGTVSVAQDTQTLTISAGAAGTFTLSFTGKNSTGTSVTDTTGPLSFSSQTLSLDIQEALNSFANIGGVGGSVSVTETSTGTFVITFGGTFAGQPVSTLSSSSGSATIAVDSIYTIVFGGTLSGQDVHTLSYVPVTTLTPNTPNTAPLSFMTTQVGASAAENIPTEWFQLGPTTVTNGQTPNNTTKGQQQAVAGSVTAAAVDPNDPNTIYIATAGGGVWKTINGGKNWYSIFSSIPEIQQITLNAPTTFTLSLGADTTNTLSTSDPNLAFDMQTDLDQLGTIGGVGGNVTIFENGTANEIQTLTITAKAGTFTLSFTGTDANDKTVTDTTSILNITDPNLASDIQSALMAAGMTNINGVGGTVTVVQSGNTYSITFGGTLAGVGLQQMTVNPVNPWIGGTITINTSQVGYTAYQVSFGGELAGFSEPIIQANPANIGALAVTELEAGASPLFAQYVGAIAIDPANPNTIYVGTGVGNNSSDSFYGTGIYVSTNAGTTWSLITNNVANNSNPNIPVNPFYGKVITAMEIDPTTDDLVVSDGDSTQGQDEVQTLTFDGIFPSPFTLTLTAANSTGLLVTDSTPAATPLNLLIQPSLLLLDIDSELDALSNIGGVGGFVDAEYVNGTDYTGGITITFEGNLSFTTLPALVTSFPLPTQVTPPAPAIGVVVSAVSGPTTDVNGTTGVAGQTPPGVWMYDAASGTWNCLTNVTSTVRASDPSANAADLIYGPDGYMPGEPDTPGPDDDYRIFFPQANATWSDVSITFNSETGQPILFAALGSSSIGTVNTAAGVPANGVYWSTDFEDAVDGDPQDVTWFVGNPYTGSASAGDAIFTPDNEYKDQFPTTMFNFPSTNPFQTDNSGGTLEPLGEEDGNIKISAYVPPPGVVVGTTSNEPIFGPDGSGNGGFAIIYATVSSAGGALKSVYFSTDGGEDWAIALSIPTNGSGNNALMSDEGQYDNAVLTLNPNTIFIGGQSSLGNTLGQTGQIYESTNAAGTWNDISNEPVTTGIGPHDSEHAIVQDDNNGVLVATDGGLWLFNTTSDAWTDLNGNLANLEVNSVASDPTNITGIPTNPATVTAIAGLQANGTAGFTQGQTWSELDDTEGGEMSTSQVFIDPTSPNIVYEEQTQIGTGMGAIIRESNNYGAAGSWTTILAGLQTAVAPFQMDQVNPERLVVGGGSTAGLYQTLDGSAASPAWTNIGVNLPIDVTAIGLAQYQGAFTTDPAFPDSTDQGADAYVPLTMYVTDGNSIYLTKDGGELWANRSIPTTQLAGPDNIVQLVVDPTNMDTVYAVRNVFGGDQIWESIDAGQKWQEIATTDGLPNVPVWSLVVDPRNGNLYAGTDIGVFWLPGGANLNGAEPVTGTWQPFGTGMPNVQVHDLVLNQTTNTLLAATYGQGVFELVLDTAETAASSVATSSLTGLSGGSVWDGNVILAGTSPVSIGADGTQNLPNGISASSIEILGQISDLVSGDDPTVQKVGFGDVIFAGPNIYGGLTDVQQGNLVVDNEQALGQYMLGTMDGTTVEIGAALELESNLGAETVTLNGDGSTFDNHNTGALRNISGNNVFLGDVILNTNTVPPSPPASPPIIPTITIGADSGSTLTMDGVISSLNDDSLVKEGTGTITLTSDNTYTGSTYVYNGGLQTQAPTAFSTGGVEVLDGGQLQLQAPDSLVVAPGSTGTFELTLAGVGTTGTLNAASSTLALDIQNAFNTLFQTLFSANPTVDAYLLGAVTLVEEISTGVFTIAFGGSLIGDNVQNVTVSNANLTFGGVVIQATPLTVNNPLTISGGGINNSGVPGALLNVGGNNAGVNNAWTGNITLALLPGFSQSTFPTGDVEIGVSGGTTLTIDGSIGELVESGQNDSGFHSVGQSAGLNKVGSGELILQNPLSSPNTYSGGTMVSQGVMVVGESGALGTHPTTDPALNTVQQVITLSDDHTGTFQLSFDGATSSMSWGITAVALEGKINSTPDGLFAKAGFLNVNATVLETPIETTTESQTTSSSPETGNLYTITFYGQLADTVDQLTATGINGTVAAANFVSQGGQDVVVNYGAELDVNNNLNPTLKLAAPITEITNTTDTILVSNTYNISVNTVLQVDNEQMQVVSIAGDYLTVTRGVNGTTIATHSNGAAVEIPVELTKAITDVNSPETIDVTNAAYIPVTTAADNSIIRIDNEDMLVTGVNVAAGTITVDRGFDGTAIAVHSLGAQIEIPIDIVGHTFTLNGTGVSTLGSGGQVVAANGALQNTYGDNILEGTVNPIVVVLPQTQPSISGSIPSVSAASGTSLTIGSSTPVSDAVDSDYLLVGGGGSGYNGNNGGGTVVLASGDSYTNQAVILGGTLQDDGTMGNIGLEGGVIGGMGTVAKIVDESTSATPEGINPGDNGQSTLTNGTLTYPNEINDELPNTSTVALTSTGVVLGHNDTYYAFVPAPAAPNTLLQVNGSINLNGATLAGYVNPDVLESFSAAATIIETNYDNGANPTHVISNYFLDENTSGSTPLDTQLTGVTGVVVHTTTAYIGNEKFLVDYIGTSSTSNVFEVVVRRVTENVTMGALTISVPTGAPITPEGTNSWEVEYGEDVKFSVDLIPEANAVNLTNSEVLFQVVDPFSKVYQVFEFVAPVTPITLVSGVTEYQATIDLAQAIKTPLATTTIMSPPGDFTISALYDGQLSDGAELFNLNPQADGTVVGEPASTTQVNIPAGSTSSADTLLVSQTPTTTRLDIAIFGTNSTTSSVYGQPITLTATVAGTLPKQDQPALPGNEPQVAPPEGTVAFYDAQPGSTSPTLLGLGTLSTTNGITTAVFQTTTLGVGDHGLYAVYDADGVPDNYTASTSNTLPEVLITQATDTVTVVATPSTINYNGQMSIVATVTGQFGGDPTGSVTFKLANGTVLGTEQLFTVGTTTSATLNTAPFGIPGSPNPQFVIAYYTGDSNYGQQQSTPYQITVNPIPSSTVVTASTSSTVAGQPVTFTATISGVPTGGAFPTGTVTWIVNGQQVTTTPVSTQFGITAATFTTTNLTPPNSTIEAIYNGDNNYLPSNNASNLYTESVTPANTTTTITALPHIATPSEAVTLTATVNTNPVGGTVSQGTVSFYDDDFAPKKLLGTAPVVNGVATILAAFGATPTPTNGGTVHTIEADYSDPSPSSFNPSSATTVVSVYPNGARASAVHLTSSQNPSILNTPVTFTATVRDNGAGAIQQPTGSIAFYYTPPGGALTFLGYGILSKTSLGVSSASYTTSILPLGIDSIIAVYSGSPLDFAAKSSAALSQTVNGNRVSSVLVQSSSTLITQTGAYTSTYGQTATFTATITDGGSTPPSKTPTGTVTFNFDNTTTNTITTETVAISATATGVATGQYTTSLTTPLPAGTYTVTATYNGNSTFIAETSPPITQQITPATSSTSIALSSVSTIYGQAVTMTATVTPEYGGTPTGTVSFYLNGSASPLATVAVVTKAGVTTASFTTAALPVNFYNITATYNGSSNLQGSSTAIAANLSVSQDGSHMALAASTTSSDESVTFTATVAANAPGGGIPTGYVSFYLVTASGDQFEGNYTLNANGKTAWTIPGGLSAGDHTIMAAYSGDNNFDPSSITETFDFIVGRGT
jgi:autotransporter-associated beta strand protein